MKLRIATVLAGILLAVGGGLAVWCSWAARQVPEFYKRAMAVAPAVQRIANDELLVNATALASNARRQGRWHAVFTAEQINGWLAVDLAENYPKLLPPEVAAPRVQITPSGAVIACRYQDGALASVVSLDVELYIDEPNVLALRLRKARAGAIPVPLAQILDGVGQAARDANLHLRWLQTDGDPVALVTLPATSDLGDTVYQLEALELRDAEVYVAGRTTRASGIDSHARQRGVGPVAVHQPAAKATSQR